MGSQPSTRNGFAVVAGDARKCALLRMRAERWPGLINCTRTPQCAVAEISSSTRPLVSMPMAITAKEANR
jgi:hypothetical protein